MSEQPHRLAVVVVAVWLSVQAIALLRGLLPLPPPWGAHLPWRMFSDPSPLERTLTAEGRAADGTWVPIPLERYFEHTRGATGERAYEYSATVFEPGRLRERQVFAEWLAERMAADGRPIDKVRLIRRWRDLRDDSTGAATIGQYRVDGG
ncbi:hypothetical protein [Nannocystis punicea]|uniref:Uncharacterized protein n=1 Tax=Nannocystis punicea TaxID=2995304 RepID=A0ABY7HIK9_9BACT|nr:hypothetical protein [Nannocystis poenicansa]WAS99149.1 hypothetical protein O0S08_23730 [Nannocystis poenicansa]